MNQIGKQSLFSTLWSYLGVIVGYIHTVLLLPAILEPSDFGTQQVFKDLAALITPFLSLGLPQSVIKYFPVAKSKQQIRGMLVQIFKYASIPLGLIGILLIFLWNHSMALLDRYEENFSTYLMPLFLLVIALVFFNLAEGWAKAWLRVSYANFIKESLARSFLVVNTLLFWWLSYDFVYFIYGISISYLLLAMVLLGYLLLKERPMISNSINKKYLPPKEFWQYSTYAILGSSGLLIVSRVDSVMVGGMLGMAENAIYMISFFMASVIEMPKRAMASLAVSLMSQYYEAKESGKIKQLYHNFSRFQLAIGIFLYGLILINLETFYYIMPKGEIYSAGFLVFVFLGATKVIDLGFGPNSEYISISNLYRYNILFLSLLALLTFGLNLLLIPMIGLIGAAIATLSAYFLFNLAKWYLLKKRIGYQPFTMSHLLILLFNIPLIIIIYSINFHLHPILQSTLASSIYLTGAFLFYRYGSTLPEFKHMIINRLNK
ncbi:MAG: polysaccharide biosynthesis C-terminal domain-containing protein [Cyclobacteriaceae bacterium]|nr:polysaccharide biosynthesis C-terminal domain-containing protein [Cyclobacteriaceae bacterium]MCH8516808.1 polysaccharide biosynthesis C-terminal domain-containing protein [Cyclobacteriaceae bacterium]